MQELLALIAAIVISSLLLLAVGVLAWRMQHHSVEAVQYSAAKAQELGGLGRTLEEDLANLGAGLTTPSLDATGAFAEYDTLAGTYEFTTWTARDTRTDDLTADDGDLVRYEVQPLTGSDVVVRDAVTRQFTTAPTVRVSRTEAGRTVAYEGVLDAKIRLFDVDGDPTLIPALGCEVEVTVRQVSPLGGGSAGMAGDDGAVPFVDQTRWTRRFRPVNLTRMAACRP